MLEIYLLATHEEYHILSKEVTYLILPIRLWLPICSEIVAREWADT